MPPIDNWRALREALDAGPTEGPWELSQDDVWPWKYKVTSPSAGYSLLCYGLWNYSTSDTKEAANARQPNAECAANARWFAAAHPTAIRSLLDERDRLAAEVEALRADDAKRDAIMLEVDYALDHGWPATSLNRIDRMRAAMKGKP